MLAYLRRLFFTFFMKAPQPSAIEEPHKRGNKLSAAAAKAKADSSRDPYSFEIKLPELAPGVRPSSDGMAMDDGNILQYMGYGIPSAGTGFPGYSYLAQLTTRAEFRMMAESLSTQLTREWIEFVSSESAGDETAQRIAELERRCEALNLQGLFKTAAEHDAYYGRGHFMINIRGADTATPLILSNKTIAIGSLERIVNVEPMWATPSAYNALDPTAPDFYKPRQWFLLGKDTHASRLLTVITRPMPDMLKPAFNFSGISLSQLAEPYVDNWLRTRQSVADLINNFSITALATSMDQVLQGNDDGTDLFARADLFTATRSNRGLMLLDKDREELVQINTPLSGLHELQSQAQEQLASVSHIPTIILLGIDPTGLNASSEGSIRAFEDWIKAQQEAHYSEPLRIILEVLQLDMFGEIDPNISFRWKPLRQMTDDEKAGIRLKDAQTDEIYFNMGAIDASEVRGKIGRDVDSGYDGLNVNELPEPPVDDLRDQLKTTLGDTGA